MLLARVNRKNGLYTRLKGINHSVRLLFSIIPSFVDPFHLSSKKSVYLFGRDGRVADILLENPSCSMQHAVIQYREKEVTR